MSFRWTVRVDDACLSGRNPGGLRQQGNYGLQGPYEPSDPDIDVRNGGLRRNPKLYYNIITDPEDGSDKPYKIPYTNW
jgi:hypothetical protein